VILHQTNKVKAVNVVVDLR